MKFNNVPTLLLFMVAGLPGCRQPAFTLRSRRVRSLWIG